jgi:predicted ATPase
MLVPTAALTGMAGIGKTQLALAYAQHHRGDYTLGWWAHPPRLGWVC